MAKRYRVPVTVTDLYWLTIDADSLADATRKAVAMPFSVIEEFGNLKDRSISTLVHQAEEMSDD